MKGCPAHGNRIQLNPSRAVNQIGATPQTDCRRTVWRWASNWSAVLSLRMICSGVCRVRFMVESRAQSGRMRTLIHRGPIPRGQVSVPPLSSSDPMADLSPISGQAQASLEVMAAPLQITASERLQLAELVRKRDVPMSRDGAIPLDALVTLVRELRGER